MAALTNNTRSCAGGRKFIPHSIAQRRSESLENCSELSKKRQKMLSVYPFAPQLTLLGGLALEKEPKFSVLVFRKRLHGSRDAFANTAVRFVHIENHRGLLRRSS